MSNIVQTKLTPKNNSGIRVVEHGKSIAQVSDELEGVNGLIYREFYSKGYSNGSHLVANDTSKRYKKLTVHIKRDRLANSIVYNPFYAEGCEGDVESAPLLSQTIAEIKEIISTLLGHNNNLRFFGCIGFYEDDMLIYIDKDGCTVRTERESRMDAIQQRKALWGGYEDIYIGSDYERIFNTEIGMMNVYMNNMYRNCFAAAGKVNRNASVAAKLVCETTCRVRVLSINKVGNIVKSYTCTDGRNVKDFNKDQLIALIDNRLVTNARKQIYKGRIIIRVF